MCMDNYYNNQHHYECQDGGDVFYYASIPFFFVFLGKWDILLEIVDQLD
jgi:hypothetical protein